MLKFLLDSLFGKRQKTHDLEVRFHKEANFFGEHGTIKVSHIKQGIVETPVRFVFVGLTTPPQLDLFTFVYLWEEAKKQGYIPHCIVTYGKENECVNTIEPEIFNDAVTPPVAPVIMERSKLAVWKGAKAK